jgi:hypothetical protein
MLKPSNLLIGLDQKIRILDYGVGALLSLGDSESLVDTRSTANVLAAGLDCVSPECILDPSKQSGAGDQYSLGCVLYFCLAGRLPFDGSAAEKLQAHQMKEAEPIRSINPEVAENLADIIAKLMQKTPSARYANMQELIAALSAVVGREVVKTSTLDPNPLRPAPTASGLHRLPVGGEAGSPIPPPVQSSLIGQPPTPRSTMSGLHRLPVGGDAGTPIPPALPAPSVIPPSASRPTPSEMHPLQPGRETVFPGESRPTQMPGEPKAESAIHPLPGSPAAPRDSGPVPMAGDNQPPPSVQDDKSSVVPLPLPDSLRAATPPSASTPSGIHPTPAGQFKVSPPGSGANKGPGPGSPKESGVTLIPGSTQILGKVARRAASEFSVFDMPPLDFPSAPPPPQEAAPMPPIPKIQMPASPERLEPTQDQVEAEPPPSSPSNPAEPQPTFEERFGKNGTIILVSIVLVLVFLIGYIVFQH